MDTVCASKKYKTKTQKLIAKNTDISKLPLMIYGISGKGKIGIGYHKPKKFLLKLKPKKNEKKPREMHSHSS